MFWFCVAVLGAIALLSGLYWFCRAPPEYLARHVYPIHDLRKWLAAASASGSPCVVFLCGAPGSGKSYYVRTLLSGDDGGDPLDVELHTLSNDTQPGMYFVRQGKVVFAPTDNRNGTFDFELFREKAITPVSEKLQELLRAIQDAPSGRPQVILFDDTNTVTRDFAGKVHMVLQAGVPVRNVAFFVADQGLSEAQEVRFLVKRQQLRHKQFCEARDAGQKPHPSDGKTVPEEKIQQFIKRLRSTFFRRRGVLVTWSDSYLLRHIVAPTKIIYTGLWLSDAERQRALDAAAREWPALLDKVIADHCTIHYGPRSSLTGRERQALGQEVVLRVTAKTPKDPRLQAFLVEAPGCPLRFVDRVPHITVSVAADVAPTFANNFLARAGKCPALKGGALELRARVGAFVEWPDRTKSVLSHKI